MVIVRLKGGLGNQLFQFAFGRAIAEYRGEQLYFDLTYLTVNPLNFIPQDFKLGKLNNVTIADQLLLKDFGTLYEMGHAAFLLDEHTKKDVFKILNNPRIKAIMLDGYYKDEFYQLKYAELIKGEIRELLNQYFNTDIAKLLIYKGEESVGVNFCKEDDLLAGGHQVQEKISSGYYEGAIRAFTFHYSNPHFYLFHNHGEGADQLFDCLPGQKINVSAIVNHMPAADNDLIQLALMSECKHFILSNSSYSWWGSYLATSKDKIIIAPKEADSNYEFWQPSGLHKTERWIRI